MWWQEMENRNGLRDVFKAGFCRLAVLAVAWLALGCGVRGDPQPPLQPTPIGRGKPTFQKRLKGLNIQIPKPTPSPTPEAERP